MQELSSQNFEDIVGKGNVIVDYWAPWCGPCKIFAPIFAEESKDHPDITFAKLNTDAEAELATQAGIRGIPTLIFFKDGAEIARYSGATPKDVLKQRIAQMYNS